MAGAKGKGKRETHDEQFERMFNLLDSVDLKLDDIFEGEEHTGVIPVGLLGLGFKSKGFGENRNAKECKPITGSISKKKCYRISVVSTDDGAKLDVTWTDSKGITNDDDGITAGKHTPCRCDKVKFQVHAKDGDVVWTIVKCDP